LRGTHIVLPDKVMCLDRRHSSMPFCGRERNPSGLSLPMMNPGEILQPSA
jgi:hypothetical protein